MTKYRPAAVALAACAASLSLAACSAGITSSSTATTEATASASTSRTASASPSPSARMLKVSGSVGTFPVPAGAKIAQNLGTGQETIVIFSLITPAKVSTFYAQALPKAGYTVTANSVVTQGGSTVAFIQFTGHGVKGNIDGLSKFKEASTDIPGLGHKNVTTISLLPK
jgi:hypothetical protein